MQRKREKQMQIGNGKQGVLIGEYCAPSGKSENEESNWLDSNPVLGYIEPACDKPQWILWFMKNGDALLYTKREYGNSSRGGPNHECTGAVEGDPIRISAHNWARTKVMLRETGVRIIEQRLEKDSSRFEDV